MVAPAIAARRVRDRLASDAAGRRRAAGRGCRARSAAGPARARAGRQRIGPSVARPAGEYAPDGPPGRAAPDAHGPVWPGCRRAGPPPRHRRRPGWAWAPTRPERERPAGGSAGVRRRPRTRPVPSPPARASPPGRRARTPCAAGDPRTPAAAAAAQLAVPGEVDAEHLVRLPLVPGRTGVDVDHRGDRRASPRGNRVRSSTPCRSRVDQRCATTSKPSANSSTAESQSKKSQASSASSRAARIAASQLAGGTSTVARAKRLPAGDRRGRLDRREQRDQPSADLFGSHAADPSAGRARTLAAADAQRSAGFGRGARPRRGKMRACAL